MSTSITLLDQNSNVNDVDIMVFEPCVLFSPSGRLGGNTTHGLGTFRAIPYILNPYTKLSYMYILPFQLLQLSVKKLDRSGSP